MEVFHSDNIGNRVPPHPHLGAPTLASGIYLAPTKDVGTDEDVVAGASYAVTVRIGFFLFGLAATTAAANVIWICPANQTIIIKIPAGYTKLYYMGIGQDSPKAYVRRLTMPGD